MPPEMDDEIKATRRVYDKYAPEHAARYWAVSLDEFWEAFAGPLAPDALVLDLGCGPGRDVAEFQRRSLRVVGADLSRGLLEEASCRVDADLVQADMRSLPFANSTFDGIWLTASLLHIPRQQAPGVLSGAGRVLRTGGRLSVAVKQGDGEGWEGASGEERFFTYYQPGELSAMVADAGFQVSNVRQSLSGSTQWIHLSASKM